MVLDPLQSSIKNCEIRLRPIPMIGETRDHFHIHAWFKTSRKFWSRPITNVFLRGLYS